ncbi:uncharacterized protein LOC105650848 [Jatropha curcas]|uniref:uncharacterized protein LOC105650848 n=1 Tax=Jatropha curcas TaxID=180498 RepID=UPI0005FB40AA|nr:uncharacterized protein LOC105650848 [Jatropha curcas]
MRGAGSDVKPTDVEKSQIPHYTNLELSAHWNTKSELRRDPNCPYIMIGSLPTETRIRNQFMKEILVPLRKASMSIKRYDSIACKSNGVSVALKKMYAKLFSENEKERYKAFLEIATKKCRERKQLLPHHIREAASLKDNSSSKEVAECQWNTLLENLRKRTKLRKCLAICGISEGMTDTEKNICVSMGLLISQFGNGCWKGKIVTCGDNPKLCEIEGNDLESRIEFLRKLELVENITPEEMVEKIFILGDMRLVQSSVCFWGIWGSFRRGYVKLPEIVLSDLKGECGWSEVARKQTGVSMISGSSNYFVTALLEGSANSYARGVG